MAAILPGFDAESRRLGAELPPPTPDTCILTRQESLKRLPRTDLVFVNAAEPEAQLQEVLEQLEILPGSSGP